MKISHVINEGMAQDEAEETNGWRAELVNQINYNTFEVKMTNTRSKESANFVVRPVDMISIGPTLQIETMDVHDLQTGQTESWTSDDPQPDGGIVYAIAMMFWDNKELQKKLWTIVDTHNTKGQDKMPGLDQRRSIGQEVDADAYIDSQEKTQAAMAKMKKGMTEAEKTAKIFHPQYVDVYFLDGPRRTPLLVNRKVPYNLIDRYIEVAIKKYNLQKSRFEFRNAEENPVTEGVESKGPWLNNKTNKWVAWYKKDSRSDPITISADSEEEVQSQLNIALDKIQSQRLAKTAITPGQNYDFGLSSMVLRDLVGMEKGAPIYLKLGPNGIIDVSTQGGPGFVKGKITNSPAGYGHLFRVSGNDVTNSGLVGSTRYNIKKIASNDNLTRLQITGEGRPYYSTHDLEAGGLDHKPVAVIRVPGRNIQGMSEEFRPTTGQAMGIRSQIAQKMNPDNSKFVWKRPNQIMGSHTENELRALKFKYSAKHNAWGGTQQMWGRLEGTLKEFAPSAPGGADRGGGNYFKSLAQAWYYNGVHDGDLQGGVKSQQDVERLLQRGIVCPDGVTRKFGIGYNSGFNGVVISSDDYYEHSDHGKKPGTMIDVRTGRPWGPYDYMEFSEDDLDEDVSEGIRVPAQQILGTKNRAKSAYYPTNVKPKVPKLDTPLTDKELTRLSQLAGINPNK
jgi:hypothetical protein